MRTCSHNREEFSKGTIQILLIWYTVRQLIQLYWDNHQFQGSLMPQIPRLQLIQFHCEIKVIVLYINHALLHLTNLWHELLNRNAIFQMLTFTCPAPPPFPHWQNCGMLMFYTSKNNTWSHSYLIWKSKVQELDYIKYQCLHVTMLIKLMTWCIVWVNSSTLKINVTNRHIHHMLEHFLNIHPCILYRRI